MADNMSDLKFGTLGNLFKYGYLGVDLFFIISGFVIAFSIEKSTLFNFIKSRMIRLYPAYWISLIITACTVYYLGGERYSVGLKQFFANFTMLNGFFKIENVDGVYWSLFVEIKFYIIISVILMSSKLKNHMNIILLCWLTLSYLHLLINFQSNNLLKALNYLLIFEYSSYFIAGILFYKIYKEGLSLKYILMLIASFLLSVIMAAKHITFLNNYYSVSVSFSVYYITFYIAGFYFIFYLISTHKMNKINKPYFLTLGLLTYPLYLIHQYVGFIIFNLFHNQINKYLLLILVVILMLVLSYLINKFFEIPVSKRMKKILNPSKASEAKQTI
jgi:peptidoglycan/LPS O-acetylase OafA/YrhL